MKYTLLILFVLCSSVLAAEQPNVVVILSDDYGYGSAGCYGADGRLVKTPNIDRLAAEGRKFTDANTTSSVCSPTRYSVMTGRYCWRTSAKSGVLSTFAPLHIETTRLNMASMLKKHGYATASVGKWHLGYGTATDSPKWRPDFSAELSPGPLDIGFDYHFGVPSNHGDVTGIYVENRFVYGLRSGKIPDGMKIAGPVPDDDNFQATYGPEDMENAKGGTRIIEVDAPRRKNQRVMATLTEKATSWIKQQPKDKPFFLYFTPVAVHNPVTPDKDLAGKSAAGLYGDWIAELDRSVGKVLDTLDQQGVAKDTLVIFSSDNGGVKEPTRTDSPQTIALNAGLAVNGALRGGKHHVWEGGFKVPFIVRWPAKVAAGSVCKEMVSLADILATTAEVVGEKLPAVDQAAEDSRSFLPALLGDGKGREDIIVHSSDGVFAIRKGPWKWIEGVPVDDVNAAVRKVRRDEFKPQLYNTAEDPAETKDVSAEHPEVVRELTALLNRYRDGGYSRELPPEGVKPKGVTVAVELPPLAGKVVLDEKLSAMPGKPWAAARGEWSAKDGAVWGAQKNKEEQGATLHVPLALTDGTIEYEIRFDGTGRHSLRVECDGKKQSFRIEISRSKLGVTKNPSQGEAKDAVEPLAAKPLKLEPKQWYPVRVTFKGNEATAQVNDVIVKGSHAVVGSAKTGTNFLVFGESAGFRNVRVIQ